MKQTEMIALALAGIAVYMIVKAKPKTAGTSTGSASNFVKEIFGADGKAFDNGWRYYDNGTAIDPNGDYYYQGQKVWSAGQGLTA